MKKFAEGLCFEKLFLIFVIGCILGAYYEETLNCIKVLIKTGNFTWVYRRGLLYGPFSPIYGAGLLLITNFFVKNYWTKFQTFIYIALFGGIFEYLICYLQETFIGTTSWNYSNQFLNINGRTTIPLMICWGFMGMIYIYYLFPKLSNLIEKIPYKFGMQFTRILFVIMILNMTITFTALGRQTLRGKNIKPYTFIGEIYDKIYTDEYLSNRFTNMVKVKG